MDVNKNEFLLSSMIKGQVNTDEQEICRYSITTSDILIARTSETINEIAYSSCLLENISNCTYSGFLLKASPKIKNIVFSPYIVLLLRSPIYRKKLMKLSTETSRALINSDNLAKLIFYIPDLKEQKKTWLLFNQLLKKITITEQKINILKKYKKGIVSHLLQNNKNTGFIHLKDIVFYESKSIISAGESIDNGQYILYKSGQKNGFTNTYTHEGIFIIANDGGEAQFKLTNGKFSYTDHCICFGCKDDATTIVLGNYLQLISKRISYVGFTGTGLKNIDRQYLNMIHVPILEYKKIARVFVSIKRAISLVEMKLDILKKIKIAMLNSLFI